MGSLAPRLSRLQPPLPHCLPRKPLWRPCGQDGATIQTVSRGPRTSLSAKLPRCVCSTGPRETVEQNLLGCAFSQHSHRHQAHGSSPCSWTPHASRTVRKQGPVSKSPNTGTLCKHVLFHVYLSVSSTDRPTPGLL